MRKILRIASLVMLVIAILFVILAFMCMDSTITLPIPVSVLQTFYKIYVIVMVALFVLSFIIPKKK